MGQFWSKLSDAFKTSQDEDVDLDKKVGREIRNLFKDQTLDDLLDHIRRIQNELDDKDTLIRLLLEENEELKRDQPVNIMVVNKQEISEK